jgi:LPS export ABC transporter permease LptF/LPS export ABC transporter permease LptG
MNRIDRYIFRELATPALIALIALTATLVGRQVSALLELIVRWSPSASEMWGLVGTLVPAALTFTIPTAVLVGVLTGFGRMSSDSESVAFRAVGLSTPAILRPVLALGLIAWVANFVLAVWIAPASVTRLREITEGIATRQLALQVRPRVFNEDLDDRVLWIQDISPSGREWRGVLMADLGTPEETEIIVAESGRIIQDDGRFEFMLSNGSTHMVSRRDPDRYGYSRFAVHTLPVPLVEAPGSAVREPDTILEAPTTVLWEAIGKGEASYEQEVEFHRRLALPFAALAFALLGFPLGMSTHRGGRSMGLVVSAFLMLVYYMFFIGGTRIASNAQMSPFIGTWAANLGFAILGVVLLLRSERERSNRVLDFVVDSGDAIRRFFGQTPEGGPATAPPRTPWWSIGIGRHRKWLRTLDLYVLKTFWFYFALILAVFTSLFIVVTLFELLSDIVKNDVGVGVIASYFFYLMPQIFYWVSPLAVLVAVLVSLGTLTQANETLAVKAGAVSLYRMALPLLLMAGALSGATYLLQDFLLPETNRLQDSFRNTIKGRAPQSYQDPLRKWMAGSDGRIYYYSYFDPDIDVFYDLAVFSFDPDTFSLREWTFTPRATWDGGRWTFENGWTRSVGQTGEDDYEAFESRTFASMRDTPDYFKKEVRVASQMTYPELRSYIDDLGNSGFDVSGLTVDLYRKVSFPLVTFIMAMIAVPFSFSTGRRGAFYGIGISIVIGIGYWGAFEIFDKLGGISQLSPMIAAWFPNLIFGFSGFWLLLKVRT